MDKGLVWASALSFAGLGVMGVVAAIVEPPHVALDDLANRLGATVTVEGLVAGLSVRGEDWMTFRISDANHSVEIVAEDPVNMSTGDRVQVTGQVGSYGGRIQLQVESAADIIVLVPWQENHVDLGTILDEPWAFLDQHVRTSGVLDKDRLVSDSRAGGLPVRGAPRASGPVLVDGLVEFNEERAQFVLTIERVHPWPA